MAENPLVPVAQYLRMSTEHQQYSLENQSSAMQKYAESQGFVIVQTYSDAARSGLVLRRRTGLRQLLQDVVAGTSAHKAILVYDVSRWGRFQDTDESAHYEFLCKSAGIPVHYCAETFANDGSLPSLIMKALREPWQASTAGSLASRYWQGRSAWQLMVSNREAYLVTDCVGCYWRAMELPNNCWQVGSAKASRPTESFWFTVLPLK